MEHHRGNSRRTKELGNGAIMSPFAGKDETPWLNPELGGHDWEQRRVSTKRSRVDGLQLGAFAHGKPKGWSSLFVCLALDLCLCGRSCYYCVANVQLQGEADRGRVGSSG